MPEVETLARKQLNEAIESRIPAIAWHATIAIVIEFNRTLRQFGTGTLLKIADQVFVVTAAHVIREAKKHDGSLCLAGQYGTFASADGEWFCSAEGQYGTSDDPFDVAVLAISEETVSRLRSSIFVRLHDIGFDQEYDTGVYCIYGFPALWANLCTESTPIMAAKPFQYVSYAFERATSGIAGYQDRFHLLLTADSTQATDIKGERFVFRGKGDFPARFPDEIGGLSGCSVWKIGDTRIPISDWDKVQPKVVATQTGVYPSCKIIKATKWVAVSTLISQAFPDLRPAMFLWR